MTTHWPADTTAGPHPGADPDDCQECKRRRCEAPHGHNPNPCYLPTGHREPHRNMWGTTWPLDPTQETT